MGFIEVWFDPETHRMTVVCLHCGEETVAERVEYEDDDIGDRIPLRHLETCPVKMLGGTPAS